MTNENDLRNAIMSAIGDVWDRAKQVDDAADEVLDLIEADRQARGEPTVLPDGSACAILSYPLPKSHWLYAPWEYEAGAVEPKELPTPILNHAQHRETVIAAVRYAVRGATSCGQDNDFDPDALVQNAAYALCGPYDDAAQEVKP